MSKKQKYAHIKTFKKPKKHKGLIKVVLYNLDYDTDFEDPPYHPYEETVCYWPVIPRIGEQIFAEETGNENPFRVVDVGYFTNNKGKLGAVYIDITLDS